MTKFDTFGHTSPCKWGRRGKKLIKPEYILGQGPTQKKLINLQTRVQGNYFFHTRHWDVRLIGHLNISTTIVATLRKYDRPTLVEEVGRVFHTVTI